MNRNTQKDQTPSELFIEKVRSWTKPLTMADVTVQDILDMYADGWLKADDVLFLGDEQ